MNRTVLSIAGSDSGGGAGVQADVKMINSLNAHACTVITAVTAQNTQEIRHVWQLDSEQIQAQLQTIIDDIAIDVVKIGMLGSAETVSLVASFVAKLGVPVVLDPVLSATTGTSLLDGNGRIGLIEQLLPHVTIITPNLPELEQLTGQTDPASGAKILHEMGVKTVIVTGGHADSDFVQEYVSTPERAFWLTNHRIDTPHTHGTGCSFASAVASAIANRYTMEDAAVIAKMAVAQAIRHAIPIGNGAGCVTARTWPESQEDVPWLTQTAEEGRNIRPQFPVCTAEKPLGLYPVVDTAEWVERLLKLGVSTIQLRNKSLTGDALEAEIVQAIQLGKQYNARLFINDYWQLAIKHNAYGVHLGQEDLDDADARAIADAGIRLGVSTHCYYEVARAVALRPSYIACGPIWETKIKQMNFGPQGIDALERWIRTLTDYPIVAIGGIDEERAKLVRQTKVDSIALIRAITYEEDWAGATNRLLEIVEGR